MKVTSKVLEDWGICCSKIEIIFCRWRVEPDAWNST